MTGNLFIFGLGYSSQAIAKTAIEAGFSVAGTVRSAEKAQTLNEQGVKAFTHESSNWQESLSRATHILSSIPPQPSASSRGAEGDVVIQHLTELDCFATARNDRGIWLGYLSTTGVYGDYGGQWVDETSELRGTNARLKRRIAAEEAWLARGGYVFRLAGIYGPGRNVLEDIRVGKARRIDKPGQVFSRIHVEDIAQTVVASMMRGGSEVVVQSPRSCSEAVAQSPRSCSEAVAQRIFNVCDDEPAPAHEVAAYGCKLLGVEPPPLIPFEQAQLSEMGQEFYSANRRVSNRRIKDNLDVTLYYPTYREGLAALARSLQRG